MKKSGKRFITADNKSCRYGKRVSNTVYAYSYEQQKALPVKPIKRGPWSYSMIIVHNGEELIMSNSRLYSTAAACESHPKRR